MNSQTPVINPSGDHEEIVTRLAKHLGTATNRRDVFNLIYGRGSRARSKKQIVAELGFTGHSQVIQDALDHLQTHHLINKVANKGQVKDRSRWLYGKDATVRALKTKIVKYADNPRAAAKVPTKRRPAVTAPVLVVKPAIRRSISNSSRAQVSPRAKLRIAVLVTNPIRKSPLQTLLEARNIKTATVLGGKANSVHVEAVLAATFDSVVDILNTYCPTVLHFSGHGGSESLLFDNENVGDEGGVPLDFDMMARLVEAGAEPPKLLVLAACDTVTGVDRFLSAVPVVIAMSDSIADDAAIEFSARFYRSLTSGATIAKSFNQAKLALEQKGYSDAHLPTLLFSDSKAADRTLV